MDNKQAAAVLREISKYTATSLDHDAAERGAYALEMVEWLLEITATGPDSPRVLYLHRVWLKATDTTDFRAFCEARFEESKKHGN